MVHGDSPRQIRANAKIVKAASSHISDARLPMPTSNYLEDSTVWHMMLHPIRELRDTLYNLGYINILKLLASAPEMIHALTSSHSFRASVISRPSLLYDHIVEYYPDLINSTVLYDERYNEHYPHFTALSTVPELRRALLYGNPDDDSYETCRLLTLNADLLHMIATNSTLEMYFVHHLEELHLATTYYAINSLPTTVPFVHPPSFTSSSSSSSSSSRSGTGGGGRGSGSSTNVASPNSVPGLVTYPALSDIYNPRAILMLDNVAHMRNAIINELRDK